MLGENVRLAFKSMAANKLRTFLTMLGIIIGIAAVIAIMTVGNSQTAENERQNSMYGVNTMNVYMWLKDGIQLDENTDMSRYQPQFTKEMLQKMVDTYSDRIEAVAVTSWAGSGTAYPDKAKDEKVYANFDLQGVNPGTSGRVYGKREGFCLETQFAPDSINHPEFIDSVLHAGEKYDFTTIFAFDVVE